MISAFPHAREFLGLHVTNKTQTVPYTGVTNDLQRGVWDHRNKTSPRSFASMYSAHILVWYEQYPTAQEAIAAETHIKGLTREEKLAMIREMNPRWYDLSDGGYD